MPDYPENAPITEMPLPLGQPAGLAAFADAASMITSPRRFLAKEIGPYHGLGSESHLDCTVSFQHLDGEFHFCIAHRWGELAPASNDQFRNIATILARQAIIVAIPDASRLFLDGKPAGAEHRELIREVNAMAKKLHFYRHLLPYRSLKEQFCRVEMTWAEARFIDPDFSNWVYASLPEALREAVERGESATFLKKSSKKLL